MQTMLNPIRSHIYDIIIYKNECKSIAKRL